MAVSAKGFVLVLVVDEHQALSDRSALARVCTDYEVASLAELQRAVRTAAWRACNQLALAAGAEDVIARAAGD